MEALDEVAENGSLAAAQPCPAVIPMHSNDSN